MGAAGALSAFTPAQPPRSASGEATSLIFSFPSGERTHPCVIGKSPIPAEGSPWPPEKVRELRQLWEMGLSHGAIALVMHLSRGKVSAKLDRLGLDRAKPVVDGRSFAVQTPRPAAQTMADIPGRMVPLLQRTGCCAPTGYDGEHLFCDEPKVSGRSYCQAHYALSVRKAP